MYQETDVAEREQMRKDSCEQLSRDEKETGDTDPLRTLNNCQIIPFYLVLINIKIHF